MKKGKDKIILSLCGGTGAWEKPYLEAGYAVVNVTLPVYDVRVFKPVGEIHGILAAPPCTHLAGSGARWWKEKGEKSLLEALSIVDACMRIIIISKPKFWCLENPVGRLSRFLGKPVIYFQPWEYGDPWTKKTCLWGNFNIPVKNPVLPVEGSKIHKYPPSDNRAELRSITPSGFANAFFLANQ